MKEILRLSFSLLAICIVAGAALGLTYEVTRPRIIAAELAAQQALYQEVLPAADTFKETTIGGRKYQVGWKGSEKVGVAAQTTAAGYGGDISIIVGMDPAGTITGVSILSHAETPGLGSKTALPEFLGQFKGLKPDQVKLTREGGSVDAVTAATISSRAVTEAVQKTVQEYLAAGAAKTDALTGATAAGSSDGAQKGRRTQP